MLSLSSTILTMSNLSMNSANLIVSTDGVLTSPPSIYTLKIRAAGMVPDRDFTIAGFTYTEISLGIWDCTRAFDFDELTTLNPIVLTVEPVRSSQIGDWTGLFTLLPNTYTVDAANDEVTLTLQGNSDDVILAVPFIKFDSKLNVGVKANHINRIVNNSGATTTVNEIVVLPDTIGAFTVYYNLAGVWTEFISGVTELAILDTEDLEILIQCDSANIADLSTRALQLGYTPGVVQYYSYWRFDALQEIEEVAAVTSDLSVAVLDFTWINGEAVSVAGSCPGTQTLDTLCGCETATAEIQVQITNNAAHSCPDGDTGMVRLGDMIHGWYPFLSDDDSSGVVIAFPAVATDADYVLMPAESKTITLTVTCSTTAGLHQFILDINRKLCENAADIAVATYGNGSVIVETAALVPVSDTNDFFALTLDAVIQGDAALVSTQNVDFVWAAHSVTETLSTSVIEVPATGDYTFLLSLQIPDDITSTVRQYAIFVNGVANTTFLDSLYNYGGTISETLSLTIGDLVSFGVFHDDAMSAHTLFETMSVTVYREPWASLPIVENVCQITMQWVVRNDVTSVTPDTVIDLEKNVGTSTNQIVTIGNGGTSSIILTGVTIPSNLANAGLQVYFPIAQTIAVGRTHQIQFTYSPLTVVTAISGIVTIQMDCGDDLQVPFLLTSHANVETCQIVPTQNQYFVEVPLNTATQFADTIQLNTGSNYGTLELTKGSGADNVSFGESPFGNETIYRTFVNEFQLLSVPVTVSVTGTALPDPSVVNAVINWVLRNDENVIICSGSLTLTYTLTLASTPVCPVSWLSDLLSAYDLRPSDSGELIAYVDIDREPSEVSEFELTFALPTGEDVVTFQTQPVLAGITWDETHISENPAYLIATVDTEVFADQQIPVKLTYIIPGDISQSPVNSTLTLTSTFANPAFTCSPQVATIYLSVELTGTAGGYETTCRVATAVDCQTANVYDESNYGADANHDLADFTLYRKITVHKPNGQDYVMSTHQVYDELIEPASSNVLAYPITVTSGGIYTVTLESAPAYNIAGAYLQDDCVVMASGSSVVFYKSLVNNNLGIEPGTGVNWESNWELIEELPSTYTNIQYYVQFCDLTSCQRDLERTVFCNIKNLCDNMICNNKCFQAYLKLKVVIRSLSEAQTLQWYDKMVELYNLAKSLCDCSTNQKCK